MFIADQITCTNHGRGTLILLRGQEPQCITHKDSCTLIVFIHETPNKDGIRRQAQISLCLATSSREPDQVNYPALIAIAVIHGTKIHQHKCKLEWAPFAIPGYIAIPCAWIRCHREINRINQTDIIVSVVFPAL